MDCIDHCVPFLSMNLLQLLPSDPTVKYLSFCHAHLFRITHLKITSLLKQNCFTEVPLYFSLPEIIMVFQNSSSKYVDRHIIGYKHIY